MSLCVQKDHMCTSEFGGLRKHQNDPACPEHVRLKVKLDTITIRRKKNFSTNENGSIWLLRYGNARVFIIFNES